MDIDIKHLITLVKTTEIFSDQERLDWLQKMETMQEEDLRELQDILEQAQRIDWGTAMADYERAVTEAEQACANAEEEMAALSS